MMSRKNSCYRIRCCSFPNYILIVSITCLYLAELAADAQTTTAVSTTTIAPGCQSIQQINNAQTQGQSGGTCNVTDNVLRVQCQSGACQSYQWSLNSCTKACENGTSTGPTNSSEYVCSSNCQSAPTPSGCNPPPAITPYYCGTTTTSTTTMGTTTTSTTTTTTTTSSTTTTTPTTTTTTTTTTTPTTTTTTTTPTTTSTSTTTTPSTTRSSTTTSIKTSSTSITTPTTTSSSTTTKPTISSTVTAPTTTRTSLVTSSSTATRATSTSTPMKTSTTPLTTTKIATSTSGTTPSTSRPTSTTVRPTTPSSSTSKMTTPSTTARTSTRTLISTRATSPTTATTTSPSSRSPTTSTRILSSSSVVTTPRTSPTTLKTSIITSPGTTSTTPKITSGSAATSPTSSKPIAMTTTTKIPSASTTLPNSPTSSRPTVTPTTGTTRLTPTTLTTGSSTSSISSPTETSKKTSNTGGTSTSTSRVTTTPVTSTSTKLTTIISGATPTSSSTSTGTIISSTTTGTLPTISTSTSTTSVSSASTSSTKITTTNQSSIPTAATTNCKGVTASVMSSTVQPAKNCSVCRGNGCSCASGLIGDGYDCVTDQCAMMTCEENEYCQGSWIKANCQFSISFVCKCDPEIGCDTGCSKAVTNLPISGYVSRKHNVTSSSTTTSTPISQMTPPSCYNRTIIDATDTDVCGKTDNQTWIQCTDGTCVPFNTTYMDCKRDCSDGIDELCPPGYATCDGCTCALPGEVDTACQNLSSVYMASPCSTSSTTTSTQPPTRPSPTMQTAKSCVVCHGPNCTCPAGYIGDGIDCAPDQCYSIVCAWNEYCQASWYKSATCQFSTSFICICDPEIGCNNDSISTSTSTSTSLKTSASTTNGTMATTPMIQIKEKCYYKNVIDSVVRGGCGYTDNVTRIQCSDGTCVPFEAAYMNCKKDCPDGIDEQCPPGFIACDNCTCSRQEEVQEICVNITSAAKVSLCSAPVPAKNCTVCHGPTCQCPPGQMGDGIDCAVDQCGVSVQCAWNEICQASWYKSASCEFTTSFSCYCDPDIGCGPVSVTTATTPTTATLGTSTKTTTSTTTTSSTSTSTSPSKTSSTTTTTSSSSSTTSSTATVTKTLTTVTKTSPLTTPPCRTIVDAVVVGGCGNNDNVTRIQCSDGTCVPYDTAYMNCKRDCADGIDEQCMPGYAMCDGCTCVELQDVNMVCADRSSVVVSNGCNNEPLVTVPSASRRPAPATVIQPAKNCTVCHGPGCTCANGSIGDGIDCVPDQCLGTTCAWNEYCQATWYKSATCQFSATFQCVCDQSMGECGGTATSPTGVRRTRPTQAPFQNNCTVCHGSNCTCLSGYLGDGVNCVPDQCNTMTCGWNEICESYWYKTSTCDFKTSFRCACASGVSCNQTTAAPEPVVCKGGEFLCRTGHRMCIPCGWVEDKVKDCDNGDDEIAGAAVQSGCASSTIATVTQYAASGMHTHKPTAPTTGPSVTRSSCGVNYFTCPGDGNCIPCIWANDGINDCSSAEDESPAALSSCAAITPTPAPARMVTAGSTRNVIQSSSDPCRVNQVRCPNHSSCVGNADGTYYCVCDSNYYSSSSGECVLHPCFDNSKPSPCDPHAWCDAGNSTTLSASYQCHCMLPYAGDGKTCQLSNAPEPPACDASHYRCPSDGTCIPTAWLLDHIRDCPNGDDEQPNLVDECKTQRSLCDSRATCTNIENGGYNCTCQLPFYGNGFTCWLPVTPSPDRAPK